LGFLLNKAELFQVKEIRTILIAFALVRSR